MGPWCLHGSLRKKWTYPHQISSNISKREGGNIIILYKFSTMFHLKPINGRDDFRPQIMTQRCSSARRASRSPRFQGWMLATLLGGGFFSSILFCHYDDNVRMVPSSFGPNRAPPFVPKQSSGHPRLPGMPGQQYAAWKIPGIFNASCWEGNFTEELCCNTAVSEVGLKDCWDSFYFYENCCAPEPGRLWRTSGAWLGTVRHKNDDGLARELVNFYHSRKASSILDLGAGDGFYAGTLRAFGLRAGCFDGNPAVREVSDKRCFQADLSEECDLGQRWDWVMSLEVAEHVPRVFETAYLNNLDRHACTGILISWAGPRQPGKGHVNGKSKEEVAFLFEQRGFWYNTTGSSWLRRKAHFRWFNNNIMVFERRQTARSLSECN